MIYLNDDLPAAIDLNVPRFGWHNLITTSNVTADEEDADHPVEYLANGSTALYWKGQNAGAQNIDVDLGSAMDFDYVGLARHNFGTAGVTYNIQYSTDDISYTTIEGPTVAPNDWVIIHEFDTVTARYFRIQITAVASEVPEIGVLYLGEILRMQRRVYVGYTPFTFAKLSTVSSGFSESGQFLGRVKRREIYDNPIKFENLTPAFIRTLRDFFSSAEEYPFFFAWRPDDYPEETAYCWFAGDPGVSNTGPNGDMSVSYDMRGIR